MPLLSIGYSPTPADIAQLELLSQAVMITAQYNEEKLDVWDARIDTLATNPSLQDHKKELYFLTALDDMIEQAKILY